tara:strand:- start:3361 stop:3570 length:210 start_codon:yes stop_codon:yes gene_type:complete
MRECHIGINIGATSIHIGVVVYSHIVDEFIFPTPSDESQERIIKSKITGIKEGWAWSERKWSMVLRIQV